MDYRNPVIPTSCVGTGVNTYLVFQIAIFFCAWADSCLNWVFPLCIIWIFATQLNSWRNANLQGMFAIVGIGFVIFNNSTFVVPLGLLCLAADQEKLHTWLNTRISDLANHINCLDIPRTFPFFGANSENTVDKIRDWMAESGMSLDLPVFYCLDSCKIRDIGLNSVHNDITDRVMLETSTEVKHMLKMAGQHRNLIAIVLLGMIVSFFGSTGLVAYLMLAILYLLTSDEGSSRLEYGSRGILVADGIYRMNTKLLGFTVEQGIGTCFNGILHVPYHVCHGMNIQLGRSLLKPTYISSRDDLVTYGGMPQYVRPNDGEEMYINTERDNGRTTYKTLARVHDDAAMITWAAVTMPGESGSPVFVNRDDKLMLVALAGRWVKSNVNNATEYARAYITLPPKADEGLYRKVVMAPGKGKTREVLPNMVAEEFVRKPFSRILVTGPTRVVCEEIYQSLVAKGFDVGLNIKSEHRRQNPRARIQIAAHNTMLDLLDHSDPIVARPSLLIIDEAHFRDRATIMLRRMGKTLMEDGVKLVEMSATLDDTCEQTSNYEIIDVKFEENRLRDIVDEELASGKRVLLFVPGVKTPQTKKLMEKWRGHSPVVLSRENFQDGMAGVNDTDRRLILSTDIAECGINVPDLDTVVDLQKKFDYYYEGGVLVADTRLITKASQVQRRGRVGRLKPGTYYYVNDDLPESVRDSASIDADICMTGRKWSPDHSNDLGISLTDKQVQVVLREGKPPTEVHLRYDALGNKLRDCSTNIAAWGRGNVIYTGCGKCKTNCARKAKFYDERLHDWLMSDRVVPITIGL